MSEIENEEKTVITLPKNKKTLSSKKGIVIIVAFLIVGIIVGINQYTSFVSEIKTNFTITEGNSSFLLSLFRGEYIGILSIQGTIEKANSQYNQEWLLSTIDTLSSDPHNKALLLYIDSPGGSVYESDEVFLALKSYAEYKPLYAYCSSLAASGGYYIACAAEKIYANRNTLTGSIGVISGQAIDITGLLEKYGVKMTTITAGKNKNMLNYNEPLSTEQKAIMQSIADECYLQFTSIVAESRHLSLEKVQTLADGRIYTAQQAVKLYLVDNIKSVDETIDLLKERFYLPQNISIQKFEYKKNKSYLESLLDISSFADSMKSDTSAILKYLDSQVAFPAYYFKF